MNKIYKIQYKNISFLELTIDSFHNQTTEAKREAALLKGKVTAAIPASI